MLFFESPVICYQALCNVLIKMHFFLNDLYNAYECATKAQCRHPSHTHYLLMPEHVKYHNNSQCTIADIMLKTGLCQSHDADFKNPK